MPLSATLTMDNCYKLDENGNVDVQVCQNGKGQKVYFLANQNLPAELTFIGSQKASVINKFPPNKLLVFSFPLANGSFEELDSRSLFAYNPNNRLVMFQNGSMCESAFANLIIILEEKGNLEPSACTDSQVFRIIIRATSAPKFKKSNTTKLSSYSRICYRCN
jgi:hypothetical protein